MKEIIKIARLIRASSLQDKIDNLKSYVHSYSDISDDLISSGGLQVAKAIMDQCDDEGYDAKDQVQQTIAKSLYSILDNIYKEIPKNITQYFQGQKDKINQLKKKNQIFKEKMEKLNKKIISELSKFLSDYDPKNKITKAIQQWNI